MRATVLAAAVLASAATTAQPSPPPTAPPPCIDPAKPGPWFAPIRADERHCDRAATAGDPWWWSLKNLGDGDTRWSVGGELRLRYEQVDPVRAGLRGGVDDDYVFYRGLVHVDGQLSPTWRVFGEIGYWNSSGRRPGPAPTDVNRGDVSQLLVEWRPSGDTFVRAGRQQVLYGSGRLIGYRHIPNIRQGFDGLRVSTALAGGRIDLFHLRPVANTAASFDDQEDSAERIAGLYWTRPDTLFGLGLDLYAFRFERGVQQYQNGAGEDRRTVGGARLSGRRGRFTINSELVLQDGRVGDQDAEAWLFQSDTQWRLRPDTPWALGLKTSQASGDSDPTDGTLETYQPIYAPPPYLMQSALFFPANLTSFQPYVEWRATARLTVVAEAQGQWRREEEDGYYAPPLIVTPLDGRGSFLGTQYGLSARYLARRDLALEAWVTRFRAAGPLERAGARDTTFLAGMATLSF